MRLFKKEEIIMSAVNPIAVSEEEPFIIGKSDLSYFANNPCRCECALVMICTSGHAEVTVDLRRGPLRPNTIVLLFPTSVLMIDHATPDFLLLSVLSRPICSERPVFGWDLRFSVC